MTNGNEDSLFSKDDLYCAVIGREGNEELLKQVPHEDLEDLAIIPRMRVDYQFDGKNVTKQMCSYMRMTGEEALEIAHKNTDRASFVCTDLNATIREMISPAAEDVLDEYHTPADVTKRIYVLTNREKHDGAAAITSSEALNKAACMIAGDYYILPSSRHEVLLVPDRAGISVEELQTMVKEVNREVVSPQDRLSDSVYHYDCHKRKVSLVTGKEEKAEQETEKRTHVAAR